MDSHTHVDMEWKDHNPFPECMMPTLLIEPFPAEDLVDDDTENDDSGAEFQKGGFSVDVSPPPMEGKPLPVTPQFGKKSSSISPLSERMQARAGFRVPKLIMSCIPPAAADGLNSGAQSPYLTIPPGLSPASLLESPVFVYNAVGHTSPTTGKLLMFGDNNNPTIFEGPSIEDGNGAFSLKYKAVEKKECLPSYHHPQLPSKEVNVNTETTIQTAQNPLGHLNQPQLNRQDFMKRSYHDSRRNHLPLDTAVASPPDHGQTTVADSHPKGECTPMAAATPAAEDGYSWRKYGQKQVKHSEYPRSYYKCTHPDCPVRKKVERSHEGHVTEIIYIGTHRHPKPAQSRRPGGPHVHLFGDATVDAADGRHGHHPASRQQQNVEARPLWHSGVPVPDCRGDGRERTSSPSVPGELCDSSASMQVVQDARVESPEGVDVTSPLSNEVDGDDRMAHGSMSQGAADAEGDELESKRRKLEPCSIEMSTASRAAREPRVVIQTKSEVDILEDGYRWRKYGQKVVKGNPNPRSYYKCTHPGCLVRKHVERASNDYKSVITTYECKHNHEVPAARNTVGHASSAALQAQAGASRPEAPLARGGLLRLGSCGAPLGLPPRDPLGPMSSYPYSLGSHNHAPLPLPLPAGLSGVEGLKLPMLSPFYRPRQAMETAGFSFQKGKVKDEAMPSNVDGAGAAGYQQQVTGRLPLGHRM